MDRITPFDLVILLALLAMFVVGYAQGVVRRLLGIGGDPLLADRSRAQLRAAARRRTSPSEWTAIAPSYSYMVAFGAVFVAAAVTLSLGIQITYRPAPLFQKYPVLDEILGGLLGVLEGFLILIAILLILDPYYNQPAVQRARRVRRVHAPARPAPAPRHDAHRRHPPPQRHPGDPRRRSASCSRRTSGTRSLEPARLLARR